MHNGEPNRKPVAHSSSQRHPDQHSQHNGQSSQQRERDISPDTLREMQKVRVSSDLLEYIQRTSFPYIRDISSYHKDEKIGQGTFGEVFKARCKKTGRIVALKKILMENEKEGFPITALREVKMLQGLKHENITELIEVCSSKTAVNIKDRSTFYLVFAFCDHDLAGLLSNKNFKLNACHVKTLFKHLLNGLNKLHRTKILHRDMKTANILVSKEGILKLADFGLARPYFAGQQKLYTNRVVTLWYRPPELLLGARQYGPQIDMWGAGCIMAEMWTKTPIMQGDTEQRQLDLIVSLCGSITPEVWPDVVNLPLYRTMKLNPNTPRILTKKMQIITQNRFKDIEGLNLLDCLLCLDPSKRKSAEEALYHTYFYTQPMAKDNIKELMNTMQGSNFEFTAGRGAHAQRRPQQQQQQQQQRTNQSTSQAIPPGHYSDMVF